MSNIIEALNWRYAVKRYKNTKLSEVELEQILETIRLTPTSLGLQPFKVLIFTSFTRLNEDQIDEYINRIAQTRNKSQEEFQGFKNSIMNFTRSMSETQFNDWAKKQTYIALGMAMSTAALLRVDSTPMEGIKHAELDAYFGLTERNLTTSVVLALGKRDSANDFLASAAKVRKSADEMFEVI